MRNSLLLFCFFAVIVFACNSGRLYENNLTIPKANWDIKNSLIYEVDMTDTISLFNVLINVRHMGNYPYSNLFLFVTIKAPEGNSVCDTVEFTLADNKGKWYGKGLGDIYDIRKMYKKNSRFRQQGKYVFKIEQAMRLQQLPGICDAGIRIEKSNNR